MPDSRRLTLAQTFSLMTRTFPSELMQVAWGVWSIIWGTMVMLPHSHYLRGNSHPQGWMTILPFWLWGILWIGKGVPHIWGALRVLQVRLSPCSIVRAHTAYITCAVTAMLDLIANSFMAIVFLIANGPLDIVWAWYTFYAVICFWIFSRVVADERKD